MPGLKTTDDYAQRSQNIHPFDLDRSGITDESVTKEDLQPELQQTIDSSSSVTAFAGDISSVSAGMESISANVKNYIESVTADYVALTSDDTIIAQTISGDIIVTLPQSNVFADAHSFNIKKEGNVGLVKIVPVGGDTIEDSLTAFITTDKTCVTIQTDAISKWRII